MVVGGGGRFGVGGVGGGAHAPNASVDQSQAHLTSAALLVGAKIATAPKWVAPQIGEEKTTFKKSSFAPCNAHPENHGLCPVRLCVWGGD